MRTTVALHASTRDRLMDLRRRWGLVSVEAVIERLLDAPPMGADALYRSRKESVDSVLRRYGVRRLIAFGSRARGDGRPESDLDLAADVPAKLDLLDMVHLREDLAEAFGVPVDLVSLRVAPPRLREHIRRDGVKLVG